MKRPLAIWAAFAACAAVCLGVLGWFTVEMLRLERESAETRQLAAVEENMRLALWRLDSAMAVIQGTESARSPADYDAFLSPGELPSPLLGRTPPFVRLHFQLHADGSITSPQALSGRDRVHAESAGVPASGIDLAWERMRTLRGTIDATRIRSALAPQTDDKRLSESFALSDADDAPPPSPAKEIASEGTVGREQLEKSETERRRREELLSQQSSLNIAEARSKVSSFYTLSRDEGKDDAVVARKTAPALAASAPAPAEAQERADFNAPASAGSIEPDALGVTNPLPEAAALLQPAWIDGELFLVRSESVSGEDRIQAVWLDWPELRAWLLARVTDLLPEARLDPIVNATPGLGLNPRRLAFLPVQLAPGIVSAQIERGSNLLRVSIGAAWTGALVGLGALALLMHGTLRLSERRGAFVSAVTHELRTPLTTFRMYTEMLAGGMVPDEAKRRSYLDTLRREAERLSHLVENVLSYARLERGRAASRIEDTTPADLLDSIAPRLRQRAEQAGMTLEISVSPEVADRALHIDVSAVDQIIFNLVDNAAKYGRPTTGAGTIAVTAGPASRPGRLAIHVADRGPGIAANMRKVLFQPFSKSATEAAHSQPGVGLGLALCRRLARQELHGDLMLESTGPEGTIFRIEAAV